METKEIKIQVPEGYEIDKEKSTFENIVFKKKEKKINCWKDLKEIEGFFITRASCTINYKGGNDAINKNVFLNEKYAKSALALAQISQLLPYYDSNVDWDKSAVKHCIMRKGNEIVIDTWQSSYHLLAFNSSKEAARFLKYNEQLVKDYFML
jgi:hypothetical protein